MLVRQVRVSFNMRHNAEKMRQFCDLQTIEEYSGLLDDLSASAKRWQEWVEVERPEEEPLPGLSPILKLLS